MALVNQRSALKASITKIAKFGNSITEDTDVADISVNNDRLVDCWNKFEDIHMQIMLVTGPNDFDFQMIEYNDAEDTYMITRAILKRALKDRDGDNKSKSSQSTIHTQGTSKHTRQAANPNQDIPIQNDFSGLRVPRMKVPEFSGEYQEWPSFRDMFMSLVGENPKIPNVQKLSYLKSCLTGETKKLIRNIKVTDANFLAAWEILKDRYENERIIGTELLNNIYSIPNSNGNAAGIKLILDTTTEALRELKNLQRPVESYDDWLVFLIVKKLDARSLEKYNESVGDCRQVITWKQLKGFLTTRFRILEGKADVECKSKSTKLNVCHVAEVPKENSKLECYYCHQNHRAKFCFSFKKKTPSERQKLAESANLCINCLSRGHTVSDCASKRSCFKCGQRHHSMLHQDAGAASSATNVKRVKSNEVAKLSKVESISSGSSLSSHHVEQKSIMNMGILLATALIYVELKCGTIVQLRALLDQGSQISMVTTFAAKRLHLKADPFNECVDVVGLGKLMPKGIVNFNFHSRTNNSQFQTMALVIDNISNYQLSNNQVNKEVLKKYPEIALADSDTEDFRRIDVLLAADIYAQVILDGIRNVGGILLQNSSLGWILSGKYQTSADELNETFSMPTISINHCETSLEKLLRLFWEIEELPADPKSLLSVDELACEKIYQETQFRNSEGRYVVRLPFKLVAHQKELGLSRGVAISSQIRMENRFKRNPVLKEKYCGFMKESLRLGHMELVPESEVEKPANKCFYMPHHAVLRDSTTTAIRVVFNASQKSSTGVSLNDLIHTGPKLQSNMFDVLTRFRKHSVCYLGDIEKMYRRILVHPDDRDYQRIVWRDDSDEQLSTYRMRVVTDGTSSAPFLAIRTVQQLAMDEKTQFPLAYDALMKDMYMDDLLTGSKTVLSGMEHIRQITEVFKSAGMLMRKWTSNVDEVLKEIPAEDRQSLPVEFNQTEFVKVLGIQWLPSPDCFGFKVKLPPAKETTTKRILLSHASKLFDPLGFLSPSTIIPKCLLQKLWQSKVKWDDPLPSEIKEKWSKFREELPKVEGIKIPRFIGPFHNEENCKIEFHGFSDASPVAYSAVVYTRVENPNGNIKVNLVAAKTKVAPVKKITIHCLELCGALLVSRLLQKVKCALEVDDIPMYGWTDSEVVLSWLNSSPGRWQQFVGNRTSQIYDILPYSQWNYVKSTENPADCASRGISVTKLINSSLWWNGPEWLSCEKSTWPSNLEPIQLSETDLMEKKSVNLALVDKKFEFLERFSSLQNLIRMTAWCLRIVNNIRKRISEKSQSSVCHSSQQRVQALPQSLHHGGPRKCRSKPLKDTDLRESIMNSYLTVDELTKARHLWIRQVQESTFSDEIQQIKSGKCVRRGKLRKLNVKINSTENLLRVGGRLTNARIPYSQKYPIVLPKDSHLTSLIIADAHVKTLHGNVQLMLNYLRQQYWILGARYVIKKYIHKRCKVCIRFSKAMLKQKMADLPRPGVEPSRIFSHTAVDYAGPIYIKEKGRGKHKTLSKGYVAVFVCLSTKAVHLEAVEDFTTRSFIETFKRFVSRKAIPEKLYSDNGANFVGATTEMSKAEKKGMNSQLKEVAALLANDKVEWQFNPPEAPHFGGLHEAAVKSMKYHLKRIVGIAHLTFTELSTLLCQIECALNSRPLCQETDDVNDMNYLTPGHFLIGTSLSSLPEPSLLDIKENRLTRWQRTQQMYQDFWKNWSNEYLTGLQQRSKWFCKEENVKIGELVLLKEDNLPPSKWIMGRISELHPGNDGLVRVVTVKCQKSSLKRPVVNLCRLPFMEPSDLNQ